MLKPIFEKIHHVKYLITVRRHILRNQIKNSALSPFAEFLEPAQSCLKKKKQSLTRNSKHQIAEKGELERSTNFFMGFDKKKIVKSTLTQKFYHPSSITVLAD